MPFPHQHLATTISDRLNVLADQLKTRTRAGLNDANHWLESVMTRFFNALMGWDLVNLNVEKSNYPAADLGDKAKRIAIQITNQDGSDKITETAAKATKHHLGTDFDKLIIFFLLPKKPVMPKRFVQPADGPVIECWDLADLLKQMPELPDQGCLQKALNALEKDLGLSSTKEYFYPSNLPGLYAGCLFLGRDDFLDQLRASLLKQTHATAITHRSAATGIAGLGGIGKTHAAVEYARRHRDDYTAQLFVSGDSPDRLRAGFSALYDVLQLGVQGDVQPDESVRVNTVLHWFAANRDWLLIVDNVDDEASAAALTAYFDKLTTGHVLITSCLQNWADNVEALNIEVLSQDASTGLLLQLTDSKRRRADDDAVQASELAKLMEGLPLALHQAAGYINEQRLTFAQYVAIYEQQAADLLGWFKNHVIHYERLDKDTPKPVLITWKTSFDKLDEVPRFWLLVFAHFAPEPVPEFLLDSAPEAKDTVKKLHLSAREALAQAETYSLITRDRDEPRFKLHRLVQQIIRLTAPEPGRAAALAMGIKLIVASNPGDPQDVRTWLRWNPLQAHAIALAAHAPDAPAPEDLSWLLGCLALLLNSKSLYSQGEPHSRRALKLDEASYGPDHPNVALRLNNLVGLLQSTNRLTEAERLVRRALGINEACYGPDHPEIACDLHNLAYLLQERGRLAEAESLMRRVLEIIESNLGEHHPEIARSLNNLAHLLQATNRLAEAEPLMRRALSIDKASCGPDHPNVARDLNNLAQLLKATNRLAEAEPLLRRALSIDEASYGPDHPDVALDLNNLAGLLQATRRLLRAEPLLRRALGILVRSMGLEHPNSQTARGNYIRLLQAMKVPKAEIQQRVQDAMEGR